MKKPIQILLMQFIFFLLGIWAIPVGFFAGALSETNPAFALQPGVLAIAMSFIVGTRSRWAFYGLFILAVYIYPLFLYGDFVTNDDVMLYSAFTYLILFVVPFASWRYYFSESYQPAKNLSPSVSTKDDA